MANSRAELFCDARTVVPGGLPLAVGPGSHQFNSGLRQKKKIQTKLAVKMEPVASETLPSDERNQEYRVQVTSKKRVTEQINKYKDILKKALDGQPDVAEETKRVLLQELLAVSLHDYLHLNVTIRTFSKSRE